MPPACWWICVWIFVVTRIVLAGALWALRGMKQSRYHFVLSINFCFVENLLMMSIVFLVVCGLFFVISVVMSLMLIRRSRLTYGWVLQTLRQIFRSSSEISNFTVTLITFYLQVIDQYNYSPTVTLTENPEQRENLKSFSKDDEKKDKWLRINE